MNEVVREDVINREKKIVKSSVTSKNIAFIARITSPNKGTRIRKKRFPRPSIVSIIEFMDFSHLEN